MRFHSNIAVKFVAISDINEIWQIIVELITEIELQTWRIFVIFFIQCISARFINVAALEPV